MSEMRPPLSDVLIEPVDDERIAHIHRRIVATRAGATQRRSLRWIYIPAIAASSVAVIALIAFGFYSIIAHHSSTKISALTFTNGDVPLVLPVQPQAREATYHFTDGSRIQLGARTRLEVLENSDARIAWIMSDGTAQFYVRPGGSRRWTIDAGLIAVDVVGTEFSIERSRDQTKVTVHQGIVRVRGERVPGGVRRVSAGEEFRIAHEMVQNTDETASNAVAKSQIEVAPGASHAETQVAHSTKMTWRELAQREQYAEAYEQLQRARMREVMARASVEDLFLLSDIARLSGHPHDAVLPLEQIVVRFPSDTRSPMAAFTQGRLLLDVLEDPRAATNAFKTAIRLGASTELLEHAYARVVEAEFRSGNYVGANTSASDYLRRYPQGRYVDRVRAWVRSDGN